MGVGVGGTSPRLSARHTCAEKARTSRTCETRTTWQAGTRRTRLPLLTGRQLISTTALPGELRATVVELPPRRFSLETIKSPSLKMPPTILKSPNSLWEHNSVVGFFSKTEHGYVHNHLTKMERKQAGTLSTPIHVPRHECVF